MTDRRSLASGATHIREEERGLPPLIDGCDQGVWPCRAAHRQAIRICPPCGWTVRLRARERSGRSAKGRSRCSVALTDRRGCPLRLRVTGGPAMTALRPRPEAAGRRPVRARTGPMRFTPVARGGRGWASRGHSGAGSARATPAPRTGTRSRLAQTRAARGYALRPIRLLSAGFPYLTAGLDRVAFKRQQCSGRCRTEPRGFVIQKRRARWPSACLVNEPCPSAAPGRA